MVGTNLASSSEHQHLTNGRMVGTKLWSSIEQLPNPPENESDPPPNSLLTIGRHERKVVSVVYPSHFEYQQPAR